MKVVQVYMSTAGYHDNIVEVIKKFEQALRQKTTFYNMVIWDLNANIGVWREHAAVFEDTCKWGTIGRNKRGLRLLEFADASELNRVNTMFVISLAKSAKIAQTGAIKERRLITTKAAMTDWDTVIGRNV